MVAYSFYKGTYLGCSITETEWPLFEKRAGEQLARFKRIFAVSAPAGSENAEAMAVCAMADALAYFTAAQNGAGGAVASASVGSVSVSYSGAAGVDMSPKAQEKELYRCASQYLDIYRGVGRC